MGDPAGIGGEIALKAWSERAARGTPCFLLLDDPDRVTALAHRIGIAAEARAIAAPGEAADAFAYVLPVLPIGMLPAVVPGRPEARHARAVIAAIDRGIDLVLAGAAAALVTNPIHKHNLHEAGFTHPGHTEYLAERTGLATAPVMMLACPELRVVPVTIHVGLAEALSALTSAAIVHCGRVTGAALRRDFGVAEPRLAVAALNPHAGEQGLMGCEEIELIAPAIAALRREGWSVSGPHPADTLFHTAARRAYDAAICMYHDQALIPLKTIDFERGVNVTLGLPFVRTSPDHGTAYDIAGSGRANPASLVAALKLAAEMAARRAGGASGERG
ncbi:MAG: 4-hydroxythreonine-4-phosphate dehydrogenase PdxA [Alphaproteobacteria bacterium]|nr:4-hydroxythreonine-4-phosphate dehydrogenase PdxA [Alphaproteobacteria bacterium]